MDTERTLTAIGIVLLITERVATVAKSAWEARRRANGSDLSRAFRNTGCVIDSFYNLYSELKPSENFHSLRLLSAHNTGAELTETMLWKGTVLATFPHDMAKKSEWNEQPLDPEYMSKILRPVVMEGKRLIRSTDLDDDGAIGALYAKLGVQQSLAFLVQKSNTEIVYGSVAFSDQMDLTAAQRDAIRICMARCRGLSNNK
jgi:hypothetical protein